MSIAAFRQNVQNKIKEAAEASRRMPEGWPDLFFYDSDVLHFFTPLCGWENHFPVIKHTEKQGNRYVTRMCNGVYGKDCKDCERQIDKGTDFCIPGYVHTIENTTKPIKSGKRAGEEIEQEPFKIIAIRAGRGQANLVEIIDADRGGYFQKKVWQLRKTGTGTDTTYLPPSPAQTEKLGENFTGVIPDYVKEAMTPPKGMDFEQLVAAYVLANYGNTEEALTLVGLPGSWDEVEKLMSTRPKKASNASARLK